MEEIWDKTWKDRNGRVVVWQTPNAWLIGWAILSIFSLLVNGKTADILSWIASASLIIWSGLEIFRGANYFRRILGLLVLVFAILSLLKSF